MTAPQPDPTSDEAFKAWWKAHPVGSAQYPYGSDASYKMTFLAGRASTTPKPGEAMELRAALKKAREATCLFGLWADNDDAHRVQHFKSDEAAAWSAVEAALVAAEREREAMREALKAIVDESVFNQQRFAEDDDADYFLRCFKAVKERARRALTKEPNGYIDPDNGQYVGPVKRNTHYDGPD